MHGVLAFPIDRTRGNAMQVFQNETIESIRTSLRALIFLINRLVPVQSCDLLMFSLNSRHSRSVAERSGLHGPGLGVSGSYRR